MSDWAEREARELYGGTTQAASTMCGGCGISIEALAALLRTVAERQHRATLVALFGDLSQWHTIDVDAIRDAPPPIEDEDKDSDPELCVECGRVAPVTDEDYCRMCLSAIEEQAAIDGLMGG